MILLNPLALAFAALLPLIVLLYLLKLRRQAAQVSTLMFWQRVTADNRRRALFQRLRQILSLLLHLLIFALLLFALARPELRAFRGSEAGLSTIVVLDARARMQARTGNGTRFDEARQVAASYLRRASARQPVALLVADAAPRVAAGLTDDEKSLLAALDSTQPTDAGGSIEEAVALAGGLLAARPGAHRIILVTDHTPAPVPGIAAAELETRLVSDPATPRENVGITRLSARPLPASPETDEVFVEIENFGSQRQTGRVELSFEGRLLDVKPYALAPGERRADVYPALAARTGIANARGWLLAHLDPDDKTADAFAPDDEAFATIPPPRPTRVLLVTRGNWFLESLLKADDQLAFDQLTPDAFQAAQAAGFDAVILDDLLPPELEDLSKLPAGNFLFLHRAPLPAAPDGPELAHPLITDLDAASPLLRLVNLRDVTVLRAQAWTLPESANDAGGWRFNAPVRSLEHPLVVTGERPGQRFVALAFGATDSDLPLRVAFPLFIRDAVGWLAGRGDATEAPGAVRAGESIMLAPGETLWTRPQRAFQPINDIPAAETLRGPGVFEPLHNGFYLRKNADGSTRWLAVNTGDREQSTLNAAPGGPAPAAPAAAPTNASVHWEAMSVWPPWVYLALGAFVFCALEWWGFHRRRTE